jgi:hypothetical protein
MIMQQPQQSESVTVTTTKTTAMTAPSIDDDSPRIESIFSELCTSRFFLASHNITIIIYSMENFFMAGGCFDYDNHLRNE